MFTVGFCVFKGLQCAVFPTVSTTERLFPHIQRLFFLNSFIVLAKLQTQ